MDPFSERRLWAKVGLEQPGSPIIIPDSIANTIAHERTYATQKSNVGRDDLHIFLRVFKSESDPQPLRQVSTCK